MQEIRQVFAWDTSDAESGAVRMERAFSRIEAAEKRQVEHSRKAQQDAKPPGAGGSKHGGHGPGDFGMGVHDALMGRTTAAIFRFGNAAKLAGIYASGIGIALEAGGHAWGHARAELEKTDQAAARLEQSFLKVSKAATFSTVGEGSAKLGSTKVALDEQIEAERGQQRDLAWWKDLKGSKSGAAYRLYDWGRAKFTGAQTVEEKIAVAKGHEDVLGQERAKVIREYGVAQNREAESAYDRLFGNPYDAQRRGLDDKKEVEIADTRSKGLAGVDDANIAEIEKRYAIEKAGIDRAEAASERQIELEREILRTREHGGDVEVNTAKLRMDAAGKTMSLYLPWTQEFKKAKNEFFSASETLAKAKRDSTVQTAQSRIDQQTAAIQPGENEDQRAARHAQLAVEGAKEKLRLYREAKGIAADIHEIERLTLAVTTAETQQMMLQRQQALARIDAHTANVTGGRDVYAAGARLRGASPEEASREQLSARVKNGRDEEWAAALKAIKQRGSLSSLSAMTAATRQRQSAEQSLGIFDLDFKRDRRRGLEQARGETASSQWASYGRHDLAQLSSERAQSRLAIEDAEFHKNPQLADERRAQQGFREKGMLVQKYLNPDGTRRNPADVQREELEHRRKQTRIDQFFGGTPDTDPSGGLHTYDDGRGVRPSTAAQRLAKMGSAFQGTSLSKSAERVGQIGLVGVEKGMDGSIVSARDALTGQRLNAREVAEHAQTMKATAARHAENAKDDRSDREIQQEIYKILDQRLPKDS